MKTNKILLALLFTGLCLFPTTAVYAEDTEVTSDGSTSTLVALNIPSSYSVMIPQTIELSSGFLDGNVSSPSYTEFSYKIKGDLKPYEYLSIKFNHKIELKNKDITETNDYSKKYATINNAGGQTDESFADILEVKFYDLIDGQIIEPTKNYLPTMNEYNTYTGVIENYIAQSGNYTGTLNFDIALKTDPVSPSE